MVSGITAPKRPVAVRCPSEVAKPAPIPLKSALRAVPELVARYGFLPGSDHRESSPDYNRVLAVDIGTDRRLVVCRDELQAIVQRRRGQQWHNSSFHLNVNPQLEKILDE